MGIWYTYLIQNQVFSGSTPELPTNFKIREVNMEQLLDVKAMTKDAMDMLELIENNTISENTRDAVNLDLKNHLEH
jgi:hypothetical protein